MPGERVHLWKLQSVLILNAWFLRGTPWDGKWSPCAATKGRVSLLWLFNSEARPRRARTPTVARPASVRPPRNQMRGIACALFFVNIWFTHDIHSDTCCALHVIKTFWLICKCIPCFMFTRQRNIYAYARCDLDTSVIHTREMYVCNCVQDHSWNSSSYYRGNATGHNEIISKSSWFLTYRINRVNRMNVFLHQAEFTFTFYRDILTWFNYICSIGNHSKIVFLFGWNPMRKLPS